MEPIGLQVIGTGQLITRAFGDALAAVGGSLPEWLVLVSIKGQRHGMLPDLGEAVGVENPTLTHQLDRMEVNGEVRRTQVSQTKVHRIELTDEGDTLFNRFLKAVVAFDRRLRGGLTDEEVAALSALLDRLRLNVSDATTTTHRGGHAAHDKG